MPQKQHTSATSWLQNYTDKFDEPIESVALNICICIQSCDSLPVLIVFEDQNHQMDHHLHIAWKE